MGKKNNFYFYVLFTIQPCRIFRLVQPVQTFSISDIQYFLVNLALLYYGNSARIPVSHQDYSTCFVGETPVLMFQQQLPCWELLKFAECLERTSKEHHLEMPCGRPGPASPSCYQEWGWWILVVSCHVFSVIWWNTECQTSHLHLWRTMDLVMSAACIYSCI